MAPYNHKEHQLPHPRLTLERHDDNNSVMRRAQALIDQNLAAPAHQMARASTFTSPAQVPASNPQAQRQTMSPFDTTSNPLGNFGMLPPGPSRAFNSNGFGAPPNPYIIHNNPFQGHYVPDMYQQMYQNRVSTNLAGWYSHRSDSEKTYDSQNFHQVQAANRNSGGTFMGLNNSPYIAANNSPVFVPNSRAYSQAPANVFGHASTPSSVFPNPSQLVARNPSNGAYSQSPANVFPPPPQPANRGYFANNAVALPSAKGYGMADGGMQNALLENYTMNNASFRSNAAFAGPDGALSRGLNASFDTSVFDVGPEYYMHGMSFGSTTQADDDDDDNDRDYTILNDDHDSALDAEHDTIPDVEPDKIIDDDDTTESFDWGSETSNDGYNHNNDTAAAIAIEFSALPTPIGPGTPGPAYPLPSAQEIKKASRHRAWSAREKAAVVHGVLWGMIALAPTTPFDGRWELISQHLATHYSVLRPGAAIRQRWERYITEEYTAGMGIHLVSANRYLESLDDEYGEVMQERAELKSFDAGAASGDKRKRVDESFDSVDADADADADPDVPLPSTPVPGAASASAKANTPQTFPPAKKTRRADPQLSSMSSDGKFKGGSWTKTFPARRIDSTAGKKRAFDTTQATSTATRGGNNSFSSSSSSTRGGGGGGANNSFTSSFSSSSNGSSIPFTSSFRLDNRPAKRQRRAPRAGNAGGLGGPTVTMNARLLVVGQKVLDTFVAGTGRPLPRDAEGILRAEVEEFAPYALAAPGEAGGAAVGKGDGRGFGGLGGGGGSSSVGTGVDDAAFEVMDVVEEEDPAELRRRLEAGCIGKGVSFLYLGTGEVGCAA